VTALLEVEGLAKAFSGVHALDGVSFAIAAGTITGLIGPNGSGKSTMIDCVSGFQRGDAGRIVLAGRDIAGLPPHKIARAGLVRTFQNVRVYDDLAVLDNLLIAAQPFDDATWYDELVRSRRYRAVDAAATARARDLIALIGLTALSAAPATILSYGQKKLLMLAAALMSRPRLVVLDEPVAGVNPSRINEIVDILRALNRAGATFLIVEHNVEFIAGLCSHVIVFEQGRKLMEGPPAQVHSDPRVVDAYLGVGEPTPLALPELP
jgi:branched-chain amino acid transport system ATP-binding protein